MKIAALKSFQMKIFLQDQRCGCLSPPSPVWAFPEIGWKRLTRGGASLSVSWFVSFDGLYSQILTSLASLARFKSRFLTYIPKKKSFFPPPPEVSLEIAFLMAIDPIRSKKTSDIFLPPPSRLLHQDTLCPA